MSCHSEFIAVRGRLNFCRMCANHRSAECLARLRFRRYGGLFAALIAVIALGVFCGVKMRASKKPEDPERGGELPHRDTVVEMLQTDPPAPSAKVLSSDRYVGMINLLFSGRPEAGIPVGQVWRLEIATDSPNAVPARLTMPFVGADRQNGQSDPGAPVRERLAEPAGDGMAAAFQESLRYIRKQPRDWEATMALRLTLEGRYRPMDGGSGGAGFAVAMLAAIQRLDLDPAVGLTGDLTIDGKARPVSGLVGKLRGAIAARCKVTLVPERNVSDVQALAIMDGTMQLWITQIFSFNSVEEALAVARRDRETDFTEAISRFEKLRSQLRKEFAPQGLQSPLVQAELKEILQRAPSHLSAATLLAAAEGRLPKKLSLSQSADEIIATCRRFMVLVLGDEAGDSTWEDQQKAYKFMVMHFPDVEYDKTVKRLDALSGVLDPRALELMSACKEYMAELKSEGHFWRSRHFFVTRQTGAYPSQVVPDDEATLKAAAKGFDAPHSKLVLILRRLRADDGLPFDILDENLVPK